MSATLQATGLAAGHGARTLFCDLDLVVTGGDVVGLVGANGAGKSTLLGLLAGELTPQAGTVALSPPDASVGHLPQEPDRVVGETVAGFLARRTGVAPARATMDTAAERLSTDTAAERLSTDTAAERLSTDTAARRPGAGAGSVPDSPAEDAYAAALDRWLALGGADLEERAAQVTAELGLGVTLDTPMTALSGGQAARAGLAALLASRYDLLLLDEPTNDLDLDGLERLERFVGGLRAGVVIVSHDREFLARTTNRIVELDLAQQQVGVYNGGYDSYLAEREVARRHAREAYEQYADTRSGLADRARMQRNWMAQGVRNARRKSTDNDKIGRKHRAETSEKQAAKARQTQRMIERLDVVTEPRKEWELRMTIAAAPRSGTVAASMSGAVVRRGSFTLGPVDARVDWADRVVITGANGSGKSTLLAALLGRIPVDEGAAGLGSGVRVGEIDQARALFDGPEPLAGAFGDAVGDFSPADVRTVLAKFGLGGDHAPRPAASLSPGERTRAALALLQAREVNLLVLDEPTNHLDLPAIEQLEQALDSFPGTLLLVTHDRRMLDTVRTTRHWTVRDGGLVEGAGR